MRKFIILALLVLLPAKWACADVNVDIKLEQKEYLLYEKIAAVVTIQNDTEYSVRFDSAKTNINAGLKLLIKRNRKHDVPKINRLPLLDYLDLQPGETKKLLIDITVWYEMAEEGNYEISAEFYAGNRSWLSQKLQFDIVPGIEAFSAERNVPGYVDRTRKYSLRYWTRDRRDIMYLRAEEEDAKIIYGVFPLGTYLKLSKPVIQTDRHGNVVVIHQSGINRYTKSTFKSEADAVVFVNQEYINGDNKVIDEEGQTVEESAPESPKKPKK